MSPIKSNRILFRNFKLQDLAQLCSLDGDPEVMKYISEGKTLTAEGTQNRLNRIIQKQDELSPFGIWIGEEKTSGRFIGWFSLKPMEEFEFPELGYRLAKDQWAKGYATEGSFALLEYAFNQINLTEVMAVTDPLNEASKRVLLKCGFLFDSIIPYYSPILDKTVDAHYFRVQKDIFPLQAESIFHIVDESAWKQAQQISEYKHPSLDSEGFIHCSRGEQVQAVMDRHYPDQINYTVLEISARKVLNKLKYEQAVDINETFPHIYAAIHHSSILNVKTVTRWL